ncbi:MAG: signal peptidase I [Bacillota bacterium]
MDKIQKKILNTISSVIFYAIIFALFVFSIANIKMRQTDDIANIIGNGFLSVHSDSMNGENEDSFASGDMIFVKIFDETMIAELSVGDIVTYYDHSIHSFNTHRIINVYDLDGITYIETQGDSLLNPDLPIMASEIIGVYQSSISGFGNSLDYLQSPKGYALFIIIPVIIIFVYEGFLLINYNKNKFEARFEVNYRKVLKTLEIETAKIRQQVMANWVQEKDTKALSDRISI